MNLMMSVWTKRLKQQCKHHFEMQWIGFLQEQYFQQQQICHLFEVVAVFAVTENAKSNKSNLYPYSEVVLSTYPFKSNS
jgi:hypothetical protein